MATDARLEEHRHHADMAPEERAGLVAGALRLEYFSLAYNILETVVGMAAGLAAGSIALIGFALDSIVESSSAAVLVWRLRREGSSKWDVESIERRAVRLVALAFGALAAYVGVKATIDLIARNEPEASTLGIGCMSLMKKPVLGGPVSNLAPASSNARGVVVDATHVYYADGVQVSRVARSGGQVSAVATDLASAVTDVAHDATSVYWIEPGAGRIAKAPKAGGAVVVLATGQSYPAAIAVDDQYVYWLDGQMSFEMHLMRAPVD